MKPVNTLKQCLTCLLGWNWIPTNRRLLVTFGGINTSHQLWHTDFVFSVNSSELRSISDRIPASPLRVPASPSRFSLSSPPSRNEPLNLSLEQVIKLTHNFSPALMIGEGYFGKVYRAELRDGHVVAIKRAKKVVFFGNYTRDYPSHNVLTVFFFNSLIPHDCLVELALHKV